MLFLTEVKHTSKPKITKPVKKSKPTEKSPQKKTNKASQEKSRKLVSKKKKQLQIKAKHTTKKQKPSGKDNESSESAPPLENPIFPIRQKQQQVTDSSLLVKLPWSVSSCLLDKVRINNR